MTRPALLPVPDQPLPEYPVPRGVRLDGHSFVKWHHLRWLHSRLCLMGDFEVKGMAIDLFCVAQLQSPVGTLPVDPAECALLIRADRARFAELCRRDIGPLHGWVPCLSDGERRLMHPVVLAQVQDALERHEVRQMSAEQAAIAKRLKRLRERLRALGLRSEALADDILIERIDDHMTRSCPGNRTDARVLQALQHAIHAGWVGRGQVQM